MRPIAQYFDAVHRYTPESAVIGVTTIGATVNTRWYQRRYTQRLIDDVLAIGDRSNVYARITPLTQPPDRGRGLESASAGASVLWIDLDSYDSQIEALAILNGLTLPPTMIVGSGRGLHAYWLLDRFYSDIDAIKARNKALTLELNRIDPNESADSVFDLARVLRIPETWNKKRDTPQQCAIVAYEPDRVYKLNQFAAATLDDVSIVCWDNEPLPGDFIEDVREKDRKLAKRILTEDGAKKADAALNGNGRPDRSRNDMHIAARLLGLGYTPAVVMSVLQHDTWFSGAKYRERQRYDYVVNTVNKAMRTHAASADRYFAQRTFLPDTLGGELDTGNHFIYTGERLYRYVNGVYKPDADEFIRLEMIQRLGRRWHSKHTAETIQWITDQSRVDLHAVNKYHGYINVANGMLNVDTGSIEPHDPRFLSTAQIPIAYDAHADTTTIDQFIAEIIPPDAVNLFWEYVGSAFIMDRYWPKAFITLVGRKNSGKSKLLEWLVGFYGGRANVSALSLHTLADNKFASSALFGRLANIFSDLDDTEVQNTGMLKTLTGDDYISGEQKFKGFFTFKPTARVFVSANQPPAVRNPDAAYFERALIVPCNNTFTPGINADPEIVAKMSTPANMAGALRRAFAGLRRLLSTGVLSVSPSVQTASDTYQFSADTVIGFVNACTVDPDYRIPKQTFYTIYRRACEDANRRPVGSDKFFRRIAENMEKFGMTEVYALLGDDPADRQRVWCYTGRQPAQTLVNRYAVEFPNIRSLPLN